MNQTISLKRVLIYINFIFGIIAWFTFITCGETRYVNIYTVVLSNMLSVENIFFIRYSLKKNNDIMFILSIVITFFYLLRIITLNYTSYSDPFEKYNFNFISAINYTLIFIILSNLFLFLGICYCNIGRKNIEISFSDDRKTEKIKPKKIIWLMIIANVLAFSSIFEGTFLERIAGFMNSIFFNTKYILLVCSIYFFYYKNINKKYKRIFYILIVLYIIGITLSGSRSGVLTVVIILLFALLSVSHDIYLKYKHLFSMFLVVPISVLFFVFATFLRQTSSTNLTVVERLNLLKSYDFNSVSEDNGVKLFLSPVFDRMGFLDYSTDLIHYAPLYRKVVNIKYYFMSIVDNVLTPGFDVFNVPKVSIALHFIHDNIFLIDKKFADNQGYFSSELTMYGEMFCLFGLFSLFVFFLIGYFLQYFILLKLRNNFDTVLKNGIILFLFYIFINSFGFDWLVLDILSLFMAYYILKISQKI